MIDKQPFEGHTRGGWNRNIRPASHYPTIYAGRNTHIAVMKTTDIPDSELEANTDLIAAAPSLLLENTKLCELVRAQEQAIEWLLDSNPRFIDANNIMGLIAAIKDELGWGE
jgi:hypothetical protein